MSFDENIHRTIDDVLGDMPRADAEAVVLRAMVDLLDGQDPAEVCPDMPPEVVTMVRAEQVLNDTRSAE